LLLPRFFPVFPRFFSFLNSIHYRGDLFLLFQLYQPFPLFSSFLLGLEYFPYFPCSLVSRMLPFLPAFSNIREDKENVNISYQTSDITVGPLIAKMYIIIAFASRRRCLLFVCWRQPGILSLSLLRGSADLQ